MYSRIILIIAMKTVNNKVKVPLVTIFTAIALILTVMYNNKKENIFN
jgi:preprotein translocase subunit SecG